MARITRGKLLLIAAVVLLAALAIAGTALAQTAPGQGGRNAPAGENGAGCHGDGGYHETMFSALGQSLGMSTEDLNKALRDGSSIRDIARAKGVSDADLTRSFRAAAQSMVSQMVENRQLTQDQADAMLQLMQSHMDDDNWLAMADMMGGDGWGSMGSMMNGASGHGGMMGSGDWSGHQGMMGSGGVMGSGGMMGSGGSGRGTSMMGRFY